MEATGTGAVRPTRAETFLRRPRIPDVERVDVRDAALEAVGVNAFGRSRGRLRVVLARRGFAASAGEIATRRIGSTEQVALAIPDLVVPLTRVGHDRRLPAELPRQTVDRSGALPQPSLKEMLSA